MENDIPLSKDQQDSSNDEDLKDLDIDQIYKDIALFFKKWYQKEMNQDFYQEIKSIFNSMDLIRLEQTSLLFLILLVQK